MFDTSFFLNICILLLIGLVFFYLQTQITNLTSTVGALMHIQSACEKNEQPLCRPVWNNVERGGNAEKITVSDDEGEDDDDDDESEGDESEDDDSDNENERGGGSDDDEDDDESDDEGDDINNENEGDEGDGLYNTPHIHIEDIDTTMKTINDDFLFTNLKMKRESLSRMNGDELDVDVDDVTSVISDKKTPISFKKCSVPQLRELLAERHIDYNAKLKKGDMVGLLESYESLSLEVGHDEN